MTLQRRRQRACLPPTRPRGPWKGQRRTQGRRRDSAPYAPAGEEERKTGAQAGHVLGGITGYETKRSPTPGAFVSR